MAEATKELPQWMPEQVKEDIQKLEAKKVEEKYKPSLKDQLVSLRYASMNKRTWHTMPFFLLYLLSCSHADISSLELVKTSGKQKFGPISDVMKKIGSLVELGVELTRACEVTRKEAKLPYLRDFLQRFAQIARVGEDMIAFLTKEYNSFMIMYTSNTERSLTRLRRFSEAYSAILSSSVLIVLIMIFTGMIWGGGVNMVTYVLPGLLVIFLVFAYVFYQEAPFVKMITRGDRPKALTGLVHLSNIITRASLIISLVIVALLCLNIIPMELGMISVALAGVPAFAIGWLGLRYSRRIDAIDERFPDFITMFATSMSTTGVSLMFAFRDISKLDFGKLTTHIRRMRAMLDIGIDKKVSWGTMQKETASELLRIHTDAFSDAVTYGAMAKNIGPLVSNSSLFVLTMRRRIEETAALLKGMVVPVHPIMCAIMGLIMAIIIQFEQIFTTYQTTGMPMIFVTSMPIPLISSYVYILVMALALVNAFIVHEVGGEQDFTLPYYFGMMLITGWLSYYLSFTMISSYLYGIGLNNSGLISGLTSS
jgi:flagellar protein FlaJ